MTLRWLAPLGVAAALAGLVRGSPLPGAPAGPAPGGPAQAGYLVVPVCTGPDFHLEVVPYVPHAGDLLLYDEGNPWYHFLYFAARTGPPTHVAVAFERDDGRPALLELVGPTVPAAKVTLVEVGPRLNSYPGAILVRRLAQPLNPVQSACLRSFAQAQAGKDFAFGRMLLQGTVFRTRFGLRRYLFGRTYMDRDRWICSELVAAAITAAGILDPHRCPANAVYPRDLAYDELYDLSDAYRPPVLWVADPHPTIHGPVVQVLVN
jgi:hypothetical protein